MNAIRALVEGAAGGGARGRAAMGGGGIDVDLLGESGTQPIRDANVLHPSYVLSQSNAERIAIGQGEEEGSHNIAPNNTSTSASSASLLEAATEHQTTEQSIEASSSSSSEASSSVEVSGIGYWTSSSSGRSFDSTLDGVSETSLDGPPHAPPPGSLSPISNANASHVHNASMASPGLGGNGVDEDLPALAALSNGPSSDTSDAVGGSQQQEEIEQNTSNDDALPLPEDNDEELQEGGGEDTGTNLAEDDHTAGGNTSDLSLKEPTPFAIETAAGKHWADGKRFPSGAVIHGIKLMLSKSLLGKGKRGVDACNVLVQTKPRGPYQKYARRQNDCGSFVVDLLRDMGYHRLLTIAAEAAYRGDVRAHEIPGGARMDGACAVIVGPRNVTEDNDGVRIARRAFCVPDSMFNCLKATDRDLALAPFSGESDVGVFLRTLLCDQYGKAPSFGELMEWTNREYALPFQLVRCTNKLFPGIDDGHFEHKLGYLLNLSANEPTRMFLLQSWCKDDGTTSHFIALVGGTVYDNDASTGGRFDARQYADEFLSGVKKAVEIVLRPRPTMKKKRKRSRKQKKRDLAQQQENDDVRANKKARLNG